MDMILRFIIGINSNIWVIINIISFAITIGGLINLKKIKKKFIKVSLCAAILFFFIIIFIISIVSNKFVEVPNVIGLNAENAKQTILESSLQFEFENESNNTNKIDKQFPKSGTYLRKGETVTLYFEITETIDSNTKNSTLQETENSLVEEEREEELSKTIIIQLDGQRFEVDRKTKIPVNSDYPDVSMEVKKTSFFHWHINNEKHSSGGLVSDPFVSSVDDPSGLYQEIKVEILRNPVFGDMIARGLAEDSKMFPDNNPWLNEFIQKTDQFFKVEINSKEAIGMDKWLMAAEDEPDKWYVNVEYRTYAEKICKLLDEFSIVGIDKFTSDGYWGVYYPIPSHSRADFYESETNLEAFILCKKATNGDIISILGFDLRDKGLLHYKHSTIDL